MGIKVPLLGPKYQNYLDSTDSCGKAFELFKGMHESIKKGDWVLQQYGNGWKKERAVEDLVSSYHPCQIYLYRSNRSK
jgi:hypothetical protein